MRPLIACEHGNLASVVFVLDLPFSYFEEKERGKRRRRRRRRFVTMRLLLLLGWSMQRGTSPSMRVEMQAA